MEYKKTIFFLLIFVLFINFTFAQGESEKFRTQKFSAPVSNKIQITSENVPDTTSFKRYQVYLGLGLPYVFNIGAKYRLNKKFFLELETGYYTSFGISTTNYVKKPSFIYADAEAEIFLGYFAPPFLFSRDFSGFGTGTAVRGNLETNFDLSIYMKLGVAYLFNRRFIPIYQWGLSYNF